MCILNSFPCKKSWQTAVNRNLERGPLLPTPTQKQGPLLYRLKSLAVMLEWTPEKVCWHLGGRTVTTRSQYRHASTSKNTCPCLLDGRRGFSHLATLTAHACPQWILSKLFLHSPTVLPDQGNATDLKISPVTDRHLHLNAWLLWASLLPDLPIQSSQMDHQGHICFTF